MKAKSPKIDELTHIDTKGRIKMVDVTPKSETAREAVACGSISMSRETLEKVKTAQIIKGDVLTVAKIAGITAAKRTGELIPLCHTILLTGIDINFELNETDSTIYIISKVTSRGHTGVEMEALTAVSVAALTIYDMCKAIDKGMVISGIRLLEKRGGKSGDYKRSDE